MKIFINNQSVSYTLEGEKNLFDVFLSLEKTIAASEGVVTALLLNGQNIALDEENLKSIELEKIMRLEIETAHKSLVRVQQLESIHEYIDAIVRIAQHASSENETHASALQYNIHAEDIQDLAQHLNRLCTSDDLKYPAVGYLFLYACKMMGLVQRDTLDDITVNQEIIDILHNVLTFVNQYKFTAQNDADSAVCSNELMVMHIPQLIKVAHLLTTGDEKYALHYFIASVDFISMWLTLTTRICENAKKRQENAISIPWSEVHKEFANTLEKLLQDLSKAFEAQDWIAVSDLIEYEIVAKIEAHATCMQEHY